MEESAQFISTSTTSLDEKIVDSLKSDFNSIDIAVAFIFKPGLELLKVGIEVALHRGANIRILTTDWHSTTEPEALQMLLEYSQDESYKGSLDVKIYSHPSNGFHPKAYLFHAGKDQSVGFVGSSNLSKSGLLIGQNVEWNYQLSNPEVAIEEFATLWDGEYTTFLTQEFIDEYAGRYKEDFGSGTLTDPPIQISHEGPTPWPIQEEALAALVSTRMEQHHSGLVVMATGLGKTWVAAFDTTRPSYSKILFIAHRQEILEQTQKVFEHINPDRSIAFYDSSKPKEIFDVTLGMVQTLANHASNLDPYTFDYIVIDEFHHAQAKSYTKLIHHFQPDFLLGLTATPFRMDNKDILELVNDNLVFEASLADGINRGFLCPFTFRSIKDVAEYENIPWRNGKLDPDELANAIETKARAEQIYEEWKKLDGLERKAMAFCQSKTHADFMHGEFTKRGIPSIAVHSDSPPGTREQALADLENGKIKAIFSVDMFNEGVDLPELDIVLMLRPTYSTVIFLQQLGRGLRKIDKNPDKRLDVLDLVGNHRSFLHRYQILASFYGAKEPSFAEAVNIVAKNDSEMLPKGCEIIADVEAIDLMKEMLTTKEKAPLEFQTELLQWYEVHGKRPRLIDLYNLHKKEIKLKQLTGGDWFSYLSNINLLTEKEAKALERIHDLLKYLQNGVYNKSHKLSVLQYLIKNEKIFGQVSIKELATSLAWTVTQDPVLVYDLHDLNIEDYAQLMERNRGTWEWYLKKNPIHALSRSDFFTFENNLFSSTFVGQDLADEAFEMVEEIVEYLMQLQRNRIKRKRFKDVKDNGSTFSPIDEDGNELDAEVTIETRKGKPIRIVFHAAGDGKNKDYVKAIDTVLQRLSTSPYATVIDAVVETLRVFELPIPDRRLDTEEFSFPLILENLSKDEILSFRRKMLQKMKGIGRAHAASKGGGNQRKRFYLTIADFDQLTLEDAKDLLAS